MLMMPSWFQLVATQIENMLYYVVTLWEPHFWFWCFSWVVVGALAALCAYSCKNIQITICRIQHCFRKNREINYWKQRRFREKLPNLPAPGFSHHHHPYPHPTPSVYCGPIKTQLPQFTADSVVNKARMRVDGRIGLISSSCSPHHKSLFYREIHSRAREMEERGRKGGHMYLNPKLIRH